MEIKDLTKALPVNPKKKPKVRHLSDIKKIVVHTTDWDVQPLELAKYDIGPNHIDSTGCPSVTYHYYIGKDGSIAKLAPEEWITWHAAGHNSNSISICLAYKTDPLFESGKTKIPDPAKVPTQAMLSSLEDLLSELCMELNIDVTNIFGHRELFGTGFIFLKGHKALRKTCPGMNINLDTLRSNVSKKIL